ncbi:MAG TPA: PaaI family thioesterase [Casimicrobiaceae bacterium]|jgi:uncharacterized protein (TIGR00369 family)|nr:PaaI family thioesterase [Casimicrobiaceae bacterium]
MALRPEFTLEAANQRGRGFLPGLFGFRVVGIGDDHLDAELDVRPEIRAPNGYLHAASVIALADTACGYGCLAHLPPDATNFTTIELKTNFLGTAREGTIGCTARPVHLGRTTHVWDATVYRSNDRRTIALFRCTQMIIYAAT